MAWFLLVEVQGRRCGCVGGSVNYWVGGLVGWWVGGLVGWWVGEWVDGWVNRCWAVGKRITIIMIVIRIVIF